MLEASLRGDSALAKSGAARTRLETIAGSPPDLSALPPGCAFAERCRLANDACRQTRPPVVMLSAQHAARCLRTDATLAAAP